MLEYNLTSLTKSGSYMTVTVSTKGQIVLPLKLRQALGIVTGMQLEAELSSDGTAVVLRPAGGKKKAIPVESLFGRFKHSGPPVAIEEMSGIQAARRLAKQGKLK
jgi:AbrB family looped-hinge helix DNA binding protein